MKRRFFRWALLVAALAEIGGCSQPAAVRQSLLEDSEDLTPVHQDLLREAVQVAQLLEKYRLALQNKDLDRLRDCFSPRYSFYDRDRQWFCSQVKKDYFERFPNLTVSCSRIEIDIVKKEPDSQASQESFDWLSRPEAVSMFSRAYLFFLYCPWGVREVLLEREATSPAAPRRVLRPPPRSSGPPVTSGGQVAEAIPLPRASPGEMEEIIVRFRADPTVEEPLGEVSFNRVIRARGEGEVQTGDYGFTFREKIVFLLEKENGNWKIISQQ